MSDPIVIFLGLLAALAALPSWLCGSILKKHAAKDGGAGSDWVPLSLLPYGLGRVRPPSSGATSSPTCSSRAPSWPSSSS